MSQPSLFDAPAGPTAAESAAWLGQLHAADQHDEATVSQRTLAAVAALLAEREQLRGIADLARRVRVLQRDYFRTKGGLSECKAAESKLDGMLKGLDL